MVVVVKTKSGNYVTTFENDEDLKKFLWNLGWGDGHVQNMLEELDQSGESTVYADFNFFEKSKA